MLFDTDVLIWAFQGHTGAAASIEGAHTREVSVITYFELIQGTRDSEQTQALRVFLDDLAFQLLPVTEAISVRAQGYMEAHGAHYGINIADALIAATAIDHGLTLCTGNARCYRSIKELTVQAFQS